MAWEIAVTVAGSETALCEGIPRKTWEGWRRDDAVPAYRVLHFLLPRFLAQAPLAPSPDVVTRLESSGQSILAEHLRRQGEILEMIPALTDQIAALRAQLQGLLAERAVDPVAIVRAEVSERAAVRVERAIAQARREFEARQGKTG